MRRRDYRTRLKLQTLSGSTAADSRGHSKKAYATAATVWGNLKQIGGDEAVIASKEILAKATHRVEIDYLTTALQTARLVVADSTARVLNVLAVDDLEDRHRTLVLTCKEER